MISNFLIVPGMVLSYGNNLPVRHDDCVHIHVALIYNAALSCQGSVFCRQLGVFVRSQYDLRSGTLQGIEIWSVHCEDSRGLGASLIEEYNTAVFAPFEPWIMGFLLFGRNTCCECGVLKLEYIVVHRLQDAVFFHSGMRIHGRCLRVHVEHGVQHDFAFFKNRRFGVFCVRAC